MKSMRNFAGGACMLVALAAAQAADPQPGDFAWEGAIEAPAQSTLVRVPVPAQALVRLQSRAAHDLRVFDAQGQPVPFALASPPAAGARARERTEAWRALPLHAAQPGAQAPKGSMQVRVDGGAQGSVWVQMGGTGAAAPPSPRLPAALFDTRQQKRPVAALVVQAQLPPNVPVRFELSTSSDLAQWTPVPVKGRVYRFDGEGAPANDTLELHEPLALEGKYLKLDWSGQDGVAVTEVAALLPSNTPPRARPAATLPEPRAAGPSALEWAIEFATPIAGLELVPSEPNTLLPLRILGRNQPSDPWRLLGTTVVYRLGSGASETSSSTATLPRPSVRWLRVEATHGMRLQDVKLAVRALFDPLELVAVAGRATPYTLAAGRGGETQGAALPLGMLAATTPQRLDALPLAVVREVRDTPAPPQPEWVRWLPAGTDSKTASLWLVLALGVLVLAAVAWSLLRQLDRGRDRRDGGA